MIVRNPTFVAWMPHNSRTQGRQLWAKQWVGTADEPPNLVHLDAGLRVVQLISSTFIFACWIVKSYERRVVPAMYIMEVVACVFCVFHLFFALIKNEFSTAYALGMEGFIDAFTITPLILQGIPDYLQGEPGGTWLTLAYLRTYRMKTAFYRLCATGILEPYVFFRPQRLLSLLIYQNVQTR